MASSEPIALPPSRREAVETGRYRTIEAGRGRASFSVLLFHRLTTFSPARLTPVLAALGPALTGGWLLHRGVETPVEHCRKHRQTLLPVRP